MVIFLLVVFGAPALLFRPWQGTEFDQTALDELSARQPEFVFIGNSMLETRIDPEHLSELLSGRPVTSLAVPGSQSAIWYLQLKNLVAELDQPPATIFVFFRNDLITQPLAPLDERNRELIVTLKRPDEEQFEAVLEASRSAYQQALHGLDRIYPVQRQNDEALKLISDVSAAFFPSSTTELSFRADDQFAFHNMVGPDLDPPPPDPEREFEDAVGNSFLPLMIETAAASGIELVFVRVQARPNTDGTVRETDAMRRYSQDLAAYLQDNGVRYFDFTGNPAVDRGLYYDSFHIDQLYLPDYTELFLREVAEVFNSEGLSLGQDR